MVGRKQFQADGIILAGGFVRLPLCRVVRLAENVAGPAVLSLLTQIIFPVTNKTFAWFYKKMASRRFRRSPETLARINEFIERRIPLDFAAARYRLQLITQNDPRSTAQNVSIPVFALSGWLDPIVPWFAVRHWLRKNCPALRDYKVIQGDHAVLVSASKAAAGQILKWMGA